MKLKGIRCTILVGLAALMLITSVAPQMAQAREFSPPGECQDLGRSISLEVADIVVPETRVVGRLELRPLAEGLTLREAKAIRADVIAKAIAMGILNEGGPEFESELVPGDFEDPEMVVVAYGFAIGPDGEIWEHLATTNCKNVGRFHQYIKEEVKEEIEELLRRYREVEIMGQPAWVQRVWFSRTTHRPPYGRIWHRIIVFRAVNDGVADSDFFAAQQIVRLTPGYALWTNSDWRSNRNSVVHSWGRTLHNPLTREWLDWGPRGVIAMAMGSGGLSSGGDAPALQLVAPCGVTEITVAISAVLVGIEIVRQWVFPVVPQATIVADPNCIRMRGEWTKTFAHGACSNRVMTLMEGGSIVRTRVPCSKWWERLITFTGYGRFRDPCWVPWRAAYQRVFAGPIRVRVRNNVVERY